MADRKGQTADPPKRIPLMPGNVRAGQVISLVEVTGGLGSTINAARLADELGADIAVLIPILDTAELLGLVKAEKGEVTLTEFGQKFQKTTKEKVRLLTSQLSKIEPFKTALDLVSRKGSVSTEEVAAALQSKGIEWYHEPDLNVDLLRTILIHWAIYAGLLSYNKEGRFEPVKK
ncbi:MAG: AAA-associated domain-containing protein [Nitrososphaerota archaeon]|nr:AAA-associated domain-containing protein [Nitrososphaerota archaeon]